MSVLILNSRRTLEHEYMAYCNAWGQYLSWQSLKNTPVMIRPQSLLPSRPTALLLLDFLFADFHFSYHTTFLKKSKYFYMTIKNFDFRDVPID